MKEDEHLFDSGSGLTVNGERAMNDVAMIIGFGMLVLLVILIPYMAILNRLAVQVPKSSVPTAMDAHTPNHSKEVILTVVVSQSDDGYIIFLDKEMKNPLPGIEALCPQIQQNLSQKTDQNKKVVFQVKADKFLIYQSIHDVLISLGKCVEGRQGGYAIKLVSVLENRGSEK